MYLVSATLASYNSTDYLHFVAKKKIKNKITKNEMRKKKENVYELKLKTCESLWFKGKGKINISISLETSSDKF